MECRIRGVRNPANRPASTSRAPVTDSRTEQIPDDGTRLVRIIGCEYKFTETEILDWLSCFGEVISEIAEEPFGNEELEPDLPPVGNGVYIVKMRLSRDLPNWIPMFGRKICLEYRGMKRQCNNCYGPHAKKFCRSERVGMANFVTGFRKKYQQVPECLYGRFAIPAAPTTPAPDQQNSLPTRSASTSEPSQAPAPSVAPTLVTSSASAASTGPVTGTRPKIKISLKRNGENDWVPRSTSSEEFVNNRSEQGVAGVVGNVSSFLSGIRASFRQDTVYVGDKVRPSKPNVKDN